MLEFNILPYLFYKPKYESACRRGGGTPQYTCLLQRMHTERRPSYLKWKLPNRSARRVTYLRAFERVTELRKLWQNQRGGVPKIKKAAFCLKNLRRQTKFHGAWRSAGRSDGRWFFLGQPSGIPGTPKRGVPHQNKRRFPCDWHRHWRQIPELQKCGAHLSVKY